jgi:hypothetical protein
MMRQEEEGLKKGWLTETMDSAAAVRAADRERRERETAEREQAERSGMNKRTKASLLFMPMPGRREEEGKGSGSKPEKPRKKKIKYMSMAEREEEMSAMGTRGTARHGEVVLSRNWEEDATGFISQPAQRKTQERPPDEKKREEVERFGVNKRPIAKQVSMQISRRGKETGTRLTSQPTNQSDAPRYEMGPSQYRRESADYRRESPYPERSPSHSRRESHDSRRESPEYRRESAHSRRESPYPGRSPSYCTRESHDSRRESHDSRRESPEYRRESPHSRRESPYPERSSPHSLTHSVRDPRGAVAPNGRPSSRAEDGRRADDVGTGTGTRPQQSLWPGDIPLPDDDLSLLDDDVVTATGTKPQESAGSDDSLLPDDDFDALA